MRSGLPYLRRVTASTTPADDLDSRKATTTIRTSRGIVAQHEIARIRVEVDLPGEVVDSMNADVVPQERERNDERHDASPVLFNRVKELAFRVGVEELLQVPHHVHEDVGMPPRRGHNRQRRHEGF